MEQKVTIQVRVPQRIRDLLEFEAGNNDMTISEYVRTVLFWHLRDMPPKDES